MKSLKIRFALGFSILFTLILGSALVVIYASFVKFTKEEFYTRLTDRATTTFRLLVQVDEVDKDLLRVIDRNTLSSLYDEEVLIFRNNVIIYASTDSTISSLDTAVMKLAKSDSIVLTNDGPRELVALALSQGSDEYIVLASAFDRFGNRKISFLKWMMIIVYISGLSVGWIATYAVVTSVIKPLVHLNNRMATISSESLDVRLPEYKNATELQTLANNFNGMLERLEQSFQFRKDFVHYASHELRTPLTAMIGVTEIALTKSLDSQQYRNTLERLFMQQKELAEMTNSLLLLSDNTKKEKYPLVRLDEVLFRSADIIRALNPEAEIQVSLEGDVAREENLVINAHEPLLILAFNNLLRNAVQYSDSGTMIQGALSITGAGLIVEFRSIGAPLTSEEVDHLFTPFYRGRNSHGIKGHGLGLALVHQILELHGATIIYSRKEPYNVFRVEFSKAFING